MIIKPKTILMGKYVALESLLLTLEQVFAHKNITYTSTNKTMFEGNT